MKKLNVIKFVRIKGYLGLCNSGFLIYGMWKNEEKFVYVECNYLVSGFSVV